MNENSNNCVPDFVRVFIHSVVARLGVLGIVFKLRSSVVSLTSQVICLLPHFHVSPSTQDPCVIGRPDVAQLRLVQLPPEQVRACSLIFTLRLSGVIVFLSGLCGVVW